MKLPNFKPMTSFGLSTGPERKAGIAAAALPKMRVPSGLAADHAKPPSIKTGAVMEYRRKLGGDLVDETSFDKALKREGTVAQLGHAGGQLAGGFAGAMYGSRPGMKMVDKGIFTGSKARTRAGFALAVGGLVAGGIGGGIVGRRVGEHAGKVVGKKSPIEKAWDDQIKERDKSAADEPKLRRATDGSWEYRRRMSGKRKAALVGAGVGGYLVGKELRKRKKAAAEVEGGHEQSSGELGTGEALGDGLRSMVRPYDADASVQVALDQGAYRRFHGHAGDGESGRP